MLSGPINIIICNSFHELACVVVDVWGLVYLLSCCWSAVAVGRRASPSASCGPLAGCPPLAATPARTLGRPALQDARAEATFDRAARRPSRASPRADGAHVGPFACLRLLKSQTSAALHLLGRRLFVLALELGLAHDSPPRPGRRMQMILLARQASAAGRWPTRLAKAAAAFLFRSGGRLFKCVRVGCSSCGGRKDVSRLVLLFALVPIKWHAASPGAF